MSASDLSQARMKKMKYFYTTPTVIGWLLLGRGGACTFLGTSIFFWIQEEGFGNQGERVLALGIKMKETSREMWGI